jgi:hypothetical protein
MRVLKLNAALRVTRSVDKAQSLLWTLKKKYLIDSAALQQIL